MGNNRKQNRLQDEEELSKPIYIYSYLFLAMGRWVGIWYCLPSISCNFSYKPRLTPSHHPYPGNDEPSCPALNLVNRLVSPVNT